MTRDLLYHVILTLAALAWLGLGIRALRELPNVNQAKLMAQHSFVLAYAEVYGAQDGKVERAHADEVAHGIQMGVMNDGIPMTLTDWYDDDLYNLAVAGVRRAASGAVPQTPAENTK